MKLSQYRKRIESVMVAKCPRKVVTKKTNEDGEKKILLTPWRYVDSQVKGGAAEVVFQTPIGYSANDLEKQSDALYASCGAPIEIEDYAGAVLVRVLLEGFPEKIPYHEGMLELTAGKEILIGYDRQGAPLIHSLRVPHLMIAGQSGYGKTDLVRWLLLQLIHNNTPEQVEIWIVDLKGFSFLPFKDIPHISRIVRDIAGAKLLLEQAVKEMERRSFQVWESQDRSQAAKFKTLFVLIDEAYMISPNTVTSKETKELAKACDEAAAKISGTGREAQIGLLYCTQRPDSQVINPLVKANMDCTIAFRTKTESNSEIILDRTDAAKLPHKTPGRVLYSSDDLKELQVPFVGDDEEWTKTLQPYKRSVSLEAKGDSLNPGEGNPVILDGASCEALYEQWKPLETGERAFDETREGETHRGETAGNRKNKSVEAVSDWTKIFRGK